jgi:hypothetical protein
MNETNTYSILKKTIRLSALVIVIFMACISLCMGLVYYVVQLHGLHEYVDIYHKKLHSNTEVDRNPIYINDVVFIKTFNKYGVIEDFGTDTVTLLYEDDTGVIKEIKMQKDMVMKVDKEALLKQHQPSILHKPPTK